MVKYQGPVRPGTDEGTFRETGESKPQYQGPVRPGTDEAVFRRTGVSGGGGSSGSSGDKFIGPVIPPEILAQRQAETQRQDVIKKEQQKIQLERERIVAFRGNLANQNAQTNIRTTLDADTSQKIRHETIINPRTNERIFIKTNLDTGKTSTRTYQRKEGVSGVRQTGGLTTSPTTTPTTFEVPASTFDVINLKDPLSIPSNVVIKVNENKILSSVGSFVGTQYTTANINLKRQTEFYIFKPIEKVLGNTIQQEFSEFYPALDFAQKDILKKGKGAINMTTLPTKIKGVANLTQPVDFTTLPLSFAEGIVTDVREQPLKNVIILGASYGIGFAVEGGSIAASSVGVKASSKLASGTGGFATRVAAKGLSYTPKLYNLGTNTIGIGAGLFYANDLFNQLDASSSPREAGKLLGVSTKDVALFGIGAFYGSKGASKAYDVLRTASRTNLPVEDVGLKSIPEVVSGKDKFVESKHFGGSNKPGVSKQLFDLKIFERAGRSYHATSTKFYGKTLTTVKGSSQFEGLYTAPTPSTRFLRTGEKPQLFGLFRGRGSPSVAQIYGKGFSTTETGEAGIGFITGVKPEIENVFPVGTTFKNIGKDVYFDIGGRRVPIDTFKYTDVLVEGGGKGMTVTGKTISSSYSSDLYAGSLISPVTFFGTGSAYSGGAGGYAKVERFPDVSSSASSSKGFVSVIKTPSYKSYGGGSSRGSSSLSKTFSSGIGSGVSSSKGSNSVSSVKTPPYQSYTSRGKSSLSKIFSSGISSGGSSYRRGSSGGSGYDGGSSYGNYYNMGNIKPRIKNVFDVSVRRGGIFRNIGSTRDLNKAINLGRGRVERTIAASYKITGGRKLILPTPKGFYKKLGKKGLIFIEKKERRIKRKVTGSKEVGQLRQAKTLKKKKKKRRLEF